LLLFGNISRQLPSFLVITSLREIVRNYQGFCKDFANAFRASCGRLSYGWQRPVAMQRARLMAKQTKITIETDSLLILCGRTPLRAWCQQCSGETEMILLEGVGVISNLLPSEVEAWIESEDLHRSQAPDGGQLICLNSLIKRVQKTKTA